MDKIERGSTQSSSGARRSLSFGSTGGTGPLASRLAIIRRNAQAGLISDGIDAIPTVNPKPALRIATTPGGAIRPIATVPLDYTPKGSHLVVRKRPHRSIWLNADERLDEIDDELELPAKRLDDWLDALVTAERQDEVITAIAPPLLLPSPSLQLSADVDTQVILPGPSNILVDYPDSVNYSEQEFEADIDRPIESRIAVNVLDRDIPHDDCLNPEDVVLINEIHQIMDASQEQLIALNGEFHFSENFPPNFTNRAETFRGPTPGPTGSYLTPYDSFVAIWPQSIIESIVTETNRYAQTHIDELVENGKLTNNARVNRWVPTNVDEIYLLLSVYMYMGIAPLTRLKDFWTATKHPIGMQRFKDLMSYNRYVLLTKFLHFVDNAEMPPTREDSQKLFKLQPIIDHLNIKFKELYNLRREISLDESLSLWKGFLSFVQTIRTKSARFGIKSFELCEARTGYLWNFEIYTGKATSQHSIPAVDLLAGKSSEIVLTLLKDLENRGHLVTMDNYYNSPLLARYLKTRGFDCLGTVRANRKHMPEDIKKLSSRVPKGTVVARCSGDVSVIAWKDSKLVNFISTYHDSTTYTGQRAGNPQDKPECVRDYNTCMGGVDLKDQKLSMYLLERKRSLKWYIKMFKRLLNISILNAYIIYMESCIRQNVPYLNHREFRLDLAYSLYMKHKKVDRIVSQSRVPHVRLRTDLRHFPCKGTSRRCPYCTSLGKSSRSSIMCKDCNVALCLECFPKWHTENVLPNGKLF